MSGIKKKGNTGEAGVYSHGTTQQPIAASQAEETAQHFSPAKLDTQRNKNTMKVNKRRRQDETDTTPRSGSSSHTPTKKTKPNKQANMSRTLEQPASLKHYDTANESSTLKSSKESETAMISGLDTALSSYTINEMNIISSSQIQSKVIRIIEALASFSFVAPTKPSVVVVRAKAAVSSKCITVVEIAKREIAKAGGKWYQYSRLNQSMAVQEKKPASTVSEGFTLGQRPAASIYAMDVDNEVEEGIDDDESGFEKMKTPLERIIEGRPKVRAVPILTIYLSRIRIESLRIEYGEQTNALT